ncbi:NAD(P)-dependent oxidoreductase [Croceicoccus sp. BE223]|uniref:NAD-dependent epimerase/dehydratase family protein n=1 Tax=Croceicoccus sp. BE223 TaxID=2817716 RepID=UPI00285FA27B|nr:NAD(P)-dependent oxidoreductase [Croceicoccus sp. BE223]MDR7103665.1 nucleoside-diphosphate-sugar epimerase [Croceicoccus sp. BE223]
MAIKGKTILVTGATGQLAGAVARGLVGDNEVIALARFSAPGSREALEAAGVTCVRGDYVTRDFDEAPEKVDYVFHAAANTKPTTMDEGMRDNAEGTAFLMHRYRDAKGFLHVSATGCYAAHPDPEHVFTEDEPLGGSTYFAPMYGVSKTATEGVVRSLCRIYDLPTIIGRMNVAYGGPYFDGGLPGRQLDQLLADEPIRLQRGQRWFQAPIHEDDITRHALIMLEKATVPATIVNWGGDEGVEVEAWVRHLGRLVGKEPIFEYDDRPRAASWIGDHSRRIALGCECKVDWREGMKRMIRARRPDVTIIEDM